MDDRQILKHIENLVDEERDLRGGLGGGPHGCGIGDVEGQHLDPGQVHGLRSAGRSVDRAGAPFEQALGEGAAQAAVGSGDKGDGVVDIHGRYART